MSGNSKCFRFLGTACLAVFAYWLYIIFTEGDFSDENSSDMLWFGAALMLQLLIAMHAGMTFWKGPLGRKYQDECVFFHRIMMPLYWVFVVLTALDLLENNSQEAALTSFLWTWGPGILVLFSRIFFVNSIPKDDDPQGQLLGEDEKIHIQYEHPPIIT